MAVIDVCTYNGEKDLWDIHYSVLKDYVDEFIVVEFDKTFSGRDKLGTFTDAHLPKVRYLYIREEQYIKYAELAEASPNTAGADHWKREFMQKESIKDTLTHLKDDDIVFIGDVDEVWDPECLPILQNVFNVVPSHAKIKLDVYTYWLNNKSNEEFWGTFVSTYLVIKYGVLNHFRSDRKAYSDGIYGWHFTSMGGETALKKKLTDSYTQDSYATPYVLEQLGDNMAKNKDFLGRDFTYEIDESGWPQYLKDNKDKYAHLCK